MLAECFAISFYAFAVMRNHLHAVLRVEPDRSKHWSDEEVLLRWARAMRHHESNARGDTLELVSPERIAQLRIQSLMGVQLSSLLMGVQLFPHAVSSFPIHGCPAFPNN